MELLKERIRRDGVIKEGNVLKVDSFLNHQVLMHIYSYQHLIIKAYITFKILI